MPMAPVAGFVAYESTPPKVIKTSSAGTLDSSICYWESAPVWACEGVYREHTPDPTEDITLQMTATFTNVAMGFRSRDTSKLTAEARDNGGVTWSTGSVSTTRRLEMNDGSASGKPHGSVTVRLTATMPNIDSMGWGTIAEFRLRIDRAVIADHCTLRTTSTTCAGADTSWFARNQWHRNFYYAVAQDNLPGVLPSVGGCNSSNCLRLNDNGIRNVRLLLVLAGRRLDTQTRHNNTLSNYLEYNNADGLLTYEQRPTRESRVAVPALNAPWNDRIILADWDPANPPVPDVANGPQVTSLTPTLRVFSLP
jgi:hypothetical protein